MSSDCRATTPGASPHAQHGTPGGLQVMWSHPSFFSMGWWHWGQGLVHRAKKSAMALECGTQFDQVVIPLHSGRQG